MLDVRPISCADFLAVMWPLVADHWAESEPHHRCTFNPDLDLYRSRESRGTLILLGAFADDVPAGYAVGWVYLHPHYQVQTGWHDALYLDPAHRHGPAGLVLMRAVEDAARERGAVLMLWSAKPGSRLDRILERTAELEEHLYRRAL